jgi:hypothetical protein
VIFRDRLFFCFDLQAPQKSVRERCALRQAQSIDRLPKVLTETGSDQVLDLCRSAERISQYRPEDAESGVTLRLRMLIRALIAPWTRHPQARPFRQLLLAKGLRSEMIKIPPMPQTSDRTSDSGITFDF